MWCCAELPEDLEEDCLQWKNKTTISGWIAPVLAITLFIAGTVLVGIAMDDLFSALDVQPPPTPPLSVFWCPLR